jgi:phenylpropionate dioxygenase-like ring-hydroxylating dioxygenase large terminal subunit
MPLLPESWLFLGRSKDLNSKPRLREIAGKKFLAFRDEQGALYVTSAHCPHMGAGLVSGEVLSAGCSRDSRTKLVCPFHKWEFDAQHGGCTHIPYAPDRSPPAWAKLTRYPATERNGLAFFFNGPREHFPLPFFNDEDPGEFIHLRETLVQQDAPWHLVPANAFDMAHFANVHGRTPYSQPHFEQHDRHARVIIDYKITGNTWADRIIRRLKGDRAQLDFTVWGGNFCLAVSSFGEPGPQQVKNRMLITLEPVNERTSLTRIFVHSQRPRGRISHLAEACRMELRRFLSQQFFLAEAKETSNFHFSPRRMLDEDWPNRPYLLWLQNLYAQGTETLITAAELPSSHQPPSRIMLREEPPTLS